MLATIAGILTLLIWIYLLLAHGRFWQVSRHLPPPLNPAQASCHVAVVVPARNEAEVIARSVTSLLNQSGNHAVHIFLVDDGSTDGTSELARRAAREAGKSSMLTVIQGRPLPPGWSGKLWAMQQGIEKAREIAPDFFLLTDADIAHGPESLATLVSIAESGTYDLTSFMVKLYCGSASEKFLIPAFVFFFFMIYPPASIANPGRQTAGAAGGSILIRPEALERAGGIAAIRNEIIDDCALARTVKGHGGRVWLGLTDSASSIRPYGSFAEVGRMISRSAFNQLHYSAWLLLLAVAGLCATFLLPPLLLFTGHLLPVISGAVAWLLMTLAYLPMVRFYRLSPLRALLLPLVAIFYIGATFHSAFRYWSGSGGQWKGRTVR